jgi:hypothetical protein
MNKETPDEGRGGLAYEYDVNPAIWHVHFL